MRTVASWIVYPTILATCLLGLAFGLSAGLPVLGAMAVANTIAVIAVAAAERWLPFRDAWARSQGDVRTDLCHAVFSSLGANAVANAMFIPLAAVGVAAGHLLHIGLWPTELPLPVQLVIALVLGEFGYYWLHRGYHQTRLWRVHGLHHSAERLYWLNSNRNHPADFLFAVLVVIGPLVLLGASDVVIAYVTVISFTVMLLQHANIEMRLGKLNAVLVGGEGHRWHHSKDLTEQHRNYGAVLMIWDVVFGTYFLPRDREPPVDVGLTDQRDFPNAYLSQLATPFQATWWRDERAFRWRER